MPCAPVTIDASGLRALGRATALVRLVILVVASSSAVAAAETATADGSGSATTAPPPLSRPSDQVYRVRWLKSARIVVDGRSDEPDWGQAAVEKHFTFPWKSGPAPLTKFRALCDETNFYFSFRVQDADIVVLEHLTDKADEVFEDRVELFLCLDERMRDYFCLEIDSRGRVLDYRSSFYRHFDRSWALNGLQAKASALPNGYEIEGCIPLASLSALGFSLFKPGARVLCGLYRAEFSHDRSGKPAAQPDTLHNLGRKLEGPPPIEEWISWADPKTKAPDFHVPASLGWLELVQ